jgi:hypothetical protein
MAQGRSPVRQEIIRAARRQRSIRLHNARKERWRYRLRRLRRAFLTMMAFMIVAIGTGIFMDGLSDTTWLLMMLLGVVAFFVLALYPPTPRPRADKLAGVELAELAGSTELWLEARRPSLPGAAVDAVDMIGVRLEQLAPQLATLDENGPAAREVRKLLAEHLPGLVESYTRIPSALRGKDHAGSTPSQQLVDGLNVIADEIEAMSCDLSRNDLDALATRGRFLETKYIGRD